jgi:hypothetical protein
MDDMDDNSAGELIDAATDAALEAIARSLNLNVDSMTEPEHFELAISCATHISFTSSGAPRTPSSTRKPTPR